MDVQNNASTFNAYNEHGYNKISVITNKSMSIIWFKDNCVTNLSLITNKITFIMNILKKNLFSPCANILKSI